MNNSSLLRFLSGILIPIYLITSVPWIAHAYQHTPDQASGLNDSLATQQRWLATQSWWLQVSEGVNLYQYCLNDSVNRLDPLGLVPHDDFIIPPECVKPYNEWHAILNKVTAITWAINNIGFIAQNKTPAELGEIKRKLQAELEAEKTNAHNKYAEFEQCRDRDDRSPPKNLQPQEQEVRVDNPGKLHRHILDAAKILAIGVAAGVVAAIGWALGAPFIQGGTKPMLPNPSGVAVGSDDALWL